MKNGNLKKVIKFIGTSYIWTIPALILFDFITKVIAFNSFDGIECATKVIIPDFFSFTLYGNTGMAWSLLNNATWLLAVISVAASGALIFYLVKKYKDMTTIYRACIYLIIAGCMGNMIDRICYYIPGTMYHDFGVIDFLSFKLFKTSHYAGYDFPVFNVADSLLCVGVFCLVIYVAVTEILFHIYKGSAMDAIVKLQTKYSNTKDAEIKKVLSSLAESLKSDYYKPIKENLKKAESYLKEDVPNNE